MNTQTFSIPAGSLSQPLIGALLACLAVCAQAGDTLDVRIENYRFQPASLRIKVGDSVRWTNGEKRTSHSVLFPNESQAESERLMPGDSFERRFNQAGRYPYRCEPHPEMSGEILVEAQ